MLSEVLTGRPGQEANARREAGRVQRRRVEDEDEDHGDRRADDPFAYDLGASAGRRASVHATRTKGIESAKTAYA